MSIHNVVIIGAGNVATNLGKAIKTAGYNIKQIYSRSEKSAKELSLVLDTDYSCSLGTLVLDADIYIISVSDSAIIDIVSEIKILNKLIVHTAGSIGMDTFSNKFNNYGVIYPLQTFSKVREIDFTNIPICIEANTKENEIALKNFSDKISKNVQVISSEQREKLHLAAVYACNFVNHMYSMSEGLLMDSGLSFDILRPLITETASKVQDFSPALVQTGPAKRDDINVIEKHIEMLSGMPEYQKMYRFVSDSIIDLNKEDK